MQMENFFFYWLQQLEADLSDVTLHPIKASLHFHWRKLCFWKISGWRTLKCRSISSIVHKYFSPSLKLTLDFSVCVPSLTLCHFIFWHLISFLINTSKKEFKVKLTFPVTSLTWRETSNTFCLMEWHKASLWAWPDGFDHDQRARKLVLSGSRLTRSSPLFQWMPWQPVFCWWGPNKAWRGVTSVHACWQPPTPPRSSQPSLSSSAALFKSSGGPPFFAEAHTSLHVGPNFDSNHWRPLLVSDGLNDSIYPIKCRGQQRYARNGIELWQ